MTVSLRNLHIHIRDAETNRLAGGHTIGNAGKELHMVGLLPLRGKLISTRGTTVQLGGHEVHIHKQPSRTAFYQALQRFAVRVAPVR